MEREHLGSRLGFILLSAGCAIGCGNVWKFPYMVGQYGGGAFVLVYLLCLFLIGVPVMAVEFSLGRASQKSPVRLYDALAPKGTKWKLHGYFAMAGNFILMMFYCVVSGWILQYFFETVTGKIGSLSAEEVSGHFGEIVSSPAQMILFTFIVVIAGFFICSFSLQGGLERVTKYMMVALLGVMLVLVIYSCTLDGAGAGLTFYLKPDFAKMKADGIGNVVFGALNQSFFTLSLGIGSMAIFGSYISKDRSLLGESFNVALLDTFVALSAGLIIFPACFTYNVEPGAGPSLIFDTLPNIFNNMAGGRIWGSLFFLFMTFAALSTVLAVFENILACVMDLSGWSRRKASLICCLAMLVLVLPCIFGFNVLSGFHPLGGGTSIQDLEDFIVSNVLLPIGSLIFVLFCVIPRVGWGWKNFLAEVNAGRGMKVKNAMYGSNYFESLGLYYLGPTDGNDYEKTEVLIKEAMAYGKSCVIHLNTKKGIGY
ncbi:MAG: sodium-dependent transporter, partial [Clostridia bacterium]|nr:sodium-dependent transporter [Clostridia bacterium]